MNLGHVVLKLHKGYGGMMLASTLQALEQGAGVSPFSEQVGGQPGGKDNWVKSLPCPKKKGWHGVSAQDFRFAF